MTPTRLTFTTVAALALGTLPGLAQQAELNQIRQAEGLSPVSRSAPLDRAAQGHADYLARTDSMTHSGDGGTDHAARIAATGYQACRTAENLAGGSLTNETVFDAWMDSPPHRRNILLGNVTEFGFAKSGNKWVLVLARPC